MSAALLDLVTKLDRLRSVQARIVLCALAHLADDHGDCGAVPMRQLARMTQVDPLTISKLVTYLETELGLITKIEQPLPNPSVFRVHPAALANPTAHRPADSRTHKAIGGPLAGQMLAPPPEAPEKRALIHSGRSLHRNRPLLYERVSGLGAGDEPAPLTPIPLRHQTDDGLTHVYRLGAKSWIYSGTDTRILTEYGGSYLAATKLAAMDILTMEELDGAVKDWHDNDARSATADTFAQFLLSHSHYLHGPGEADIPLSPRLTQTVLDAHQAWTLTKS